MLWAERYCRTDRRALQVSITAPSRSRKRILCMTPPQLPPLRIGLGYDSHRLGNDGPLRIGGIEIPAEVHAIGHSDADVLLHAITDALLGAIAEPDIGQLFPDTDPKNRGRE